MNKIIILLPMCFCCGVEGADWGGGAGTLKLFKGWPCCLFSLAFNDDLKLLMKTKIYIN